MHVNTGNPNHLLFLGTYIQDIGGMTPIFFMFTDRMKAYDVIEAITGGRMHPAWFRIGGVAHDLPRGWEKLVKDFIDWMPKRLDEYVKAAIQNSILKARTIGVAQYNADEAIAWGVTGPGLRAMLSTLTCVKRARTQAMKTLILMCL